MAVDIRYWLLNKYKNYLHCDNMFGIQSIKYLYIAVTILTTHVIYYLTCLTVMINILSNKSPYPLKLFHILTVR